MDSLLVFKHVCWPFVRVRTNPNLAMVTILEFYTFVFFSFGRKYMLDLFLGVTALSVTLTQILPIQSKFCNFIQNQQKNYWFTLFF